MQTTTTGHNWSGTKSQKQIQILDSYDRKTVTNLYTGDNAVADAKKDGFNISEWKGRDVSASDIWEGAKNNPEFQRAGETLGNVATVASLIVGPELLVGKVIANVARGSKAFKVAQQGGKHSGFLKNYANKSTKELNKAVESLINGKRGINVHMDKIKNPSKYVDNWDDLRPSHQQSLLKGWQKEIDNASEQVGILREILKQ
jgi:hypothetical protein